MPAAKVTIPAHKIYKYCSPRVVEDWEYQDALKKERQEEELQKAEEDSRTHTAKSAVRKAPKARPKPPRARRVARPPPEPKLDKEDQELLEKKKLSGPSLSTPQKRKLADFLFEDPYHNQDDKLAISRQLFSDGTDFDSEATGQIPSTETGGSELDVSSRASSVLPPTSHQSLRTSPVRQDVPYNGPSQPQTRGPTKIHSIFPAQNRPSGGPSSKTDISRTISKPQIRREKQSHAQLLESIRQSSLLVREEVNSISPRHSAAKISGKASAVLLQPSQTNHTSITSKLPTSDSGGKGVTRITPIPLPSLPQLSTPSRSSSLADEKTRQDASHPRTATPGAAVNAKNRSSMGTVANTDKQSNGSSPTNTFTPVAAARHSFLQLHGKKPPSSTDRPSQEAAVQPAISNGKSSGKKRQKVEIFEDEYEEPAAEAEQVWEVKRLEGDRIFEIDGQPVRHFKVRWEGDWPPDQNPTWEPEDNIGRALVRKYLKKKGSRGGDLSVPKQRTLSPWAKRYSSVQEAFEAGTENGIEAPLRIADEEDDEVEQLIVTEDANHGDRPSPATKDSFDLALARQYTAFSKG